MTRLRSLPPLVILLLTTGGSQLNAFGCAACFGKSDSPMAQGMNMGIFSLLAVIVSVLAGVAGFFIYLARRSGQVAAAVPQEHLQATSSIQHD